MAFNFGAFAAGFAQSAERSILQQTQRRDEEEDYKKKLELQFEYEERARANAAGRAASERRTTEQKNINDRIALLKAQGVPDSVIQSYAAAGTTGLDNLINLGNFTVEHGGDLGKLFPAVAAIAGTEDVNSPEFTGALDTATSAIEAGSTIRNGINYDYLRSVLNPTKPERDTTLEDIKNLFQVQMIQNGPDTDEYKAAQAGLNKVLGIMAESGEGISEASMIGLFNSTLAPLVDASQISRDQNGTISAILRPTEQVHKFYLDNLQAAVNLSTNFSNAYNTNPNFKAFVSDKASSAKESVIREAANLYVDYKREVADIDNTDERAISRLQDKHSIVFAYNEEQARQMIDSNSLDYGDIVVVSIPNEAPKVFVYTMNLYSTEAVKSLGYQERDDKGNVTAIPMYAVYK